MAQTVDVVVETPRGSRNKYEWDDEVGATRFDRRLPGAFAFPADYGFIPQAMGSDGEHLDALVLMVEPAYPGVRVRCRVIGVIWIRTSSDRREAKLVCVPDGEPAYDDVQDLADLPEYRVAELVNFFDIYRTLDDSSGTRSDGHGGAGEARRVLDDRRKD